MKSTQTQMLNYCWYDILFSFQEELIKIFVNYQCCDMHSMAEIKQDAHEIINNKTLVGEIFCVKDFDKNK